MRASVSITSFKASIFEHVTAAQREGKSIAVRRRGRVNPPVAYLVPADIVNDMLDGSAATRKAAAERLLASLEED